MGHEALRRLVLLLVQFTTLVDRYPANQSKWVRVQVSWTEDVQMVLDAGLRWLDAPAPGPHISAYQEMMRAAQRRYWERQRAARLGIAVDPALRVRTPKEVRTPQT
jgi:hypothetical protein